MVPLAHRYDPPGGGGHWCIPSEKVTWSVEGDMSPRAKAERKLLREFEWQTSVPCKGVPILEAGVISQLFWFQGWAS